MSLITVNRNLAVVDYDMEEAPMAYEVAKAAIITLLQCKEDVQTIFQAGSQLQFAHQLLASQTEEEFNNVYNQMNALDMSHTQQIQQLFQACAQQFTAVSKETEGVKNWSNDSIAKLVKLIESARQETINAFKFTDDRAAWYNEELAKLQSLLNTVIEDVAKGKDHKGKIQTLSEAYLKQKDAIDEVTNQICAQNINFNSFVEKLRGQAVSISDIQQKLSEYEEKLYNTEAEAKKAAQSVDFLKEAMRTTTGVNRQNFERILAEEEKRVHTFELEAAKFQRTVESIKTTYISRASVARQTEANNNTQAEILTRIISLESQARKFSNTSEQLERRLRDVEQAASERLSTFNSPQPSAPYNDAGLRHDVQAMRTRITQLEQQVSSFSNVLSRLQQLETNAALIASRPLESIQPSNARSNSDILSTAKLQGWISTNTTGLLQNMFTNQNIINTLAQMKPYSYPFTMSAQMATLLSTIVSIHNDGTLTAAKMREDIRDKLGRVTPSQTFSEFIDSTATRQDLAELVTVLSGFPKKEDRTSNYNIIRRARMETDVMVSKEVLVSQANGTTTIVKNGSEMRFSSLLNF